MLMKMKMLVLVVVIAWSVTGIRLTSAQGIPVIDVTKIAQDETSQATNVAKYIEMIDEYKTQIDQMKQQYEALTGSRGLGEIDQNPELRDYLPADWQKVYDDVAAGGYSGLTGSAAAIRDQNAIYDACSTQSGTNKTVCARAANKSAQDKDFAVGAFDKAKQRWDQISQLMSEINSTSDPKAIAELQARINAEQAAIQNEHTKMQMFAMVAQAEDRLIEQAQRENDAKFYGNMQWTVPSDD